MAVSGQQDMHAILVQVIVGHATSPRGPVSNLTDRLGGEPYEEFDKLGEFEDEGTM